MTAHNQVAVNELLGEWGFSRSLLARMIGVSVSVIRYAQNGYSTLQGDALTRAETLNALCWNAHLCGTVEPAAAFETPIIAHIGVTLGDIFTSGDDSIVEQALNGKLAGPVLLDAWQPDWRAVYEPSTWTTVQADDGWRSIVAREPEDIAAQRAALGYP